VRAVAAELRDALARASYCALLVLTICSAGCSRPDDAPKAAARPSAPEPKTPDRLPPGQLLEGEQSAFGLPVPRNMKLERKSKRIAHVRGRVSLQELGDYLRARVLVQHVEMSEQKLVFPKVQLRSDASAPPLRLELIDEGVTTHLIVQNLFAPPAMPGLTDEQRWERAGRTPGGALDAHRLE